VKSGPTPGLLKHRFSSALVRLRSLMRLAPPSAAAMVLAETEISHAYTYCGTAPGLSYLFHKAA